MTDFDYNKKRITVSYDMEEVPAMPAKNTTKVLIGGKIVTLSGYESEEYLQKVASYMNRKIAQLSELPGYNRQPMETKHTLLSLNISDDYFKAKRQAEVFEEDSQLKDKEMYDLKHDLIDAQIQVENLTAENENLKKQIQQLEADMENLLK